MATKTIDFIFGMIALPVSLFLVTLVYGAVVPVGGGFVTNAELISEGVENLILLPLLTTLVSFFSFTPLITGAIGILIGVIIDKYFTKNNKNLTLYYFKRFIIITSFLSVVYFVILYITNDIQHAYF